MVGATLSAALGIPSAWQLALKYALDLACANAVGDVWEEDCWHANLRYVCHKAKMSFPWHVLYREVLTVALPVVQPSTGVAQADERDPRFPRLPWTATATGWVSGGRGSGHGSCFYGDTTMGVYQHKTCKLRFNSHTPTLTVLRFRV